jgi:hypothetical protein
VDVGLLNGAVETKSTVVPSKTASQSKVAGTLTAKDPRLEAVVNLLGEHMPSEPFITIEEHYELTNFTF